MKYWVSLLLYLQNANTLKEGRKGLKEFLIKQVKSNEKYSKKSKKLGAKLIREDYDFVNPDEKKLKSNKSLQKRGEFSSEVESYMSKLDNLLNKSENLDVITKISSLEDDVANDSELTTKQLTVIYSATQTAKYSLKYWRENLHKWKNLKNKNLSSSSSNALDPVRSDWWEDAWNEVKRIGKADIAGAAGGATSAAVVNLAPGPGQVAYGSAIAGGAAAGSVYQGVYDAL